MRLKETRSPRGLRVAAGTLLVLAVGALPLALASSDKKAESPPVEVRDDVAQELELRRKEVEAARAEIARLDRVRADQFQELVGLRRELASVRTEIEAAFSAQTRADEAEIARLDRVRQNLFEELVRSRRETASALSELHVARAAREADLKAEKTASVKEPPQEPPSVKAIEAPSPTAKSASPPQRKSSNAPPPSQAPARPRTVQKPIRAEVVRPVPRLNGSGRNPLGLPSPLTLQAGTDRDRSDHIR
jgi:hypothetical protein